MRPSVPDVHITETFDANLATYRPLAWQAIVGMIFGLLSPLALLGTTLWALPLFGIAISYWALRRIRRFAPAIVGKKMAWTGMALSLFFASAASVDYYVYRWIVRTESRQFADLFYAYLSQDEPHKAYQLSLLPTQRQSPKSRLWHFYRENDKACKEMHQFVAMPVVRTLLALGPKAQTRFYDFGKQFREDDVDAVTLYYATTYDDSGERKTFFTKALLARFMLPEDKAGWRLLSLEGGINPENSP